MRLVVLDYETFYSDSYTLSTATTESYIRDPRFEAHGAAIKWQHNIPAKWYPEKELRFILAQEDWSDVLLVAQVAICAVLVTSSLRGVTRPSECAKGWRVPA